MSINFKVKIFTWLAVFFVFNCAHRKPLDSKIATPPSDTIFLPVIMASQPSRLRVMSFNVHGTKLCDDEEGGVNRTFLVDYLVTNNIDVLFLQESECGIPFLAGEWQIRLQSVNSNERIYYRKESVSLLSRIPVDFSVNPAVVPNDVDNTALPLEIMDDGYTYTKEYSNTKDSGSDESSDEDYSEREETLPLYPSDAKSASSTKKTYIRQIRNVVLAIGDEKIRLLGIHPTHSHGCNELEGEIESYFTNQLVGLPTIIAGDYNCSAQSLSVRGCCDDWFIPNFHVTCITPGSDGYMEDRNCGRSTETDGAIQLWSRDSMGPIDHIAAFNGIRNNYRLSPPSNTLIIREEADHLFFSDHNPIKADIEISYEIE